MNERDYIPGKLYATGGSSSFSSSDDVAQIIGGIVYYLVAALVYLIYAKNVFGIGLAIVYSLFWPFGIGIEIIQGLL